MRVGVAGVGRVGSALAVALSRCNRSSGVTLSGVFARRPRDARALVRACGRGQPFPSASDLAGASDVLLICVPDAAIAEVAEALASGPSLRGKMVLHVSGSLDLRPLRAGRDHGASIGAVHPLASFPPPIAHPPSAVPIPRIWFAIAGDRRARISARRIVSALGALPLPRVLDGSAYHLAATMTANFTAVLAAAALEILSKRGGPREPISRPAFAALLRTVADRIEHEGPLRGLTGPAARGDLVTLRRHLSVLGTTAPRWRPLYLELSAEAARMASRRGTLPRTIAAEVLRWHRDARRAPSKPSRRS